MPSVLFTYNSGAGAVSQHFIWKVPDDFNVDAALTVNQQFISKLKLDLPVYHTRAMRKEFINAYGRFISSTNPYVLRSIQYIDT